MASQASLFSIATIGYNRGTVFSVQPVLRCYKQDSWSNVLVVRQSLAGRNMSMEAEDIVGNHHQATIGEERMRRLNTCCIELQSV
jgi:hypothetical protein